ncbi:MAG: hypothetical protein KC550_06300 [Nanoarchaeota archaeon]|nr:hypothetical protein [Nanoarchaeota archaeon]
MPEKKKKLTDEELKLFSYFEGICYKNESIFNKTYIDEDDYLMIDCNLITEMKNSESEVIVIQISMPNTFNERVDKFLINYGINHDTYINSEDIYKKRNYNFRFSMLNDIINLRKAIENISSDSYMKHRISRIKLMNNKVMFNPYTSPISKNHIINGDNIFRMNFRFLKSVSESDSIEIVKKLGGKNIACTMTINVCYGEFDIRVLNKTDFDSRIVSIGFAGLEPIWQKSDLKNTPISEMKYCEEPLNCIPVGCSCSCSGGLGFSYEDIVNTEYRKEWYLQNECRPAGVCPMVVCPKVEIGCENNICVVIK